MQLGREEKAFLAAMIVSIGLLIISFSCLSNSYGSWNRKYFFQLSITCFVIAIAIGITTILIYLVINKYFSKGKEYGRTYAHIKYQLRKDLMQAGYVEKGIADSVNPPKVEIEMADDLTTGKIKIRNSPKIDRPLQSINLSPSLGNYVVETSYLTEDENWYSFDFYDSNLLKQLQFSNVYQVREFVKTIGKYQLVIDERTVIKLQHMLIVGATRSGKTYTLYWLLLQVVMKPIKYDLYVCDPKRSSLWILGNILEYDNVGSTADEIIDIIRKFDDDMQNRAEEIEPYQKEKLDGDYRDFNMSPKILIIDEYASFIGQLNTRPKAERDEVMSHLRNIVLMGAQLGCFAIILMQKSSASTIETMLRDNLTFKAVLGNAEKTTYETAFGSGVEIPNFNYKQGQGVYTDVAIANKPRIMMTPTLQFDILTGFRQAERMAGVM